MDTSASPRDFLLSDPLKITLSILSLLKLLTRCSPSTQRIASTIFDFPEPFGPITQAIPSLNFNLVLFAKDLNPNNSNFDRYIIPLNY